MKKLLVLLALAFVFVSGAAFAAEFVEGEVLVVIEAPQSAMSVAQSDANAFASALSVQAQSYASSIGAQAVATYPEIAKSGKSIVHIRKAGATTAQLIAEVKKAGGVLSVSPNYIYRVLRDPNDTHYSTLWGMKNIGADKVWDSTTGSKDVVVAVVDTGINYNHPDIAANMVVDSAGKHGKRFYNGSSMGNDPMDIHAHGTHVAGTIGAVGNNSVGVAGVNWSVGLLAVNVFTRYGAAFDQVTAYTSDIVGGLHYVLAENNNNTGPLKGKIKVVNMSIGGWHAAPDSAYKAAIESLSNAGIIIAVAAGNEAQDISNPGFDPDDGTDYRGKLPYPASFRIANMITVGAITDTNAKADFSNYSPAYVDIAAPGVQIYSTVPSSYNSSGYAYMSGTSMASPMTAGAAALLCAAFPTKTATEIKKLMMDNARNVGTATLWLKGLLDVAKAHTAGGGGGGSDPVTSVTVTPASTDVGVDRTVTLTAAVSPSTANQGVTWKTSAAGIATVTVTAGVVTVKGIAPGTATITATSTADPTKTGTCIVTVRGGGGGEDPVTSVTVSPASKDLGIDETATLTVEVLPATANKNVTWKSSDESKATVTVAASGVVTVKGIAAGTATITATSTADSTKTGTCIVTVRGSGPVPPTPVASVTITPTSRNVDIDAEITLTAVVRPAAADQGVQWTTNDATKATVTAGGVVKGIAAGTAIITATTEGKDASGNSKKATCTVTVGGGGGSDPVTGLTLNVTAAAVVTGKTMTLTAKVLPTTANQSVTWTTNAAGVASVSDGVVTGVAAGTATITATSTADTTKTATCRITVADAPVGAVSADEVFVDETVIETIDPNLQITDGGLELIAPITTATTSGLHTLISSSTFATLFNGWTIARNRDFEVSPAGATLDYNAAGDLVATFTNTTEQSFIAWIPIVAEAPLAIAAADAGDYVKIMFTGKKNAGGGGGGGGGGSSDDGGGGGGGCSAGFASLALFALVPLAFRKRK